MKRVVIPLLLLLAVPAIAAEHGASAEGSAKGGKPGTNVDMPYLMAPLTDADGKLIGYAYISSRLTAASESVVVSVREKLPFIQDLFVRNVNAARVTVADDPQKVDIPVLETRLLADARKVMGANKIRQITVCTVQIAELRPKQTPALHTPPEKAQAGGEAPKNPVQSRCQA